MLDRYVYKGGSRLRCGYTTGSCAAAAAKAAAFMLIAGRSVEEAEISLPDGSALTLPVEEQVISDGDYASCCVVKDSGDDPDVTNGIHIYACVSLSGAGVEITGGEGIGVVTKAGLDQPVGEFAINSVPRKMIAAAVQEAAEELGYTRGFRIVISAPEGAALAERTYNPRMGIEGGISIIGTTGIVEPMSSRALVETIRTEAEMLRAGGAEDMLLTLGNYSDKFVQEQLGIPLGQAVKCSNFIGDAIDIGVGMGFRSILIVGHAGKMVKLGAGVMNTHSSYADCRMETIVTCGLLAGADPGLLAAIPDCVTVDAAFDILLSAGGECFERTLAVLAERIGMHLNARAGGRTKIGGIVFSYKHPFILKAAAGAELLDMWKNKA